MTTNFFTQMKPLLEKGLDFTFTMRLQGDNLIVGVRPDYGKVENENFKLIRPLLLTHPADKLDDGFFETITQPMENYLDVAKQVESWITDVKAKGEKAKSEAKPEAAPKAKVTAKAPAKKAVKAKAPAKPAAPKVDVSVKLLESAKESLAKAGEIMETDPKKALAVASAAVKTINLKKTAEFLALKKSFQEAIAKATNAIKTADLKKKEEEKEKKELDRAAAIAKQGKGHFDIGEFEKALDSFRKAYAIKPLPQWATEIQQLELKVQNQKEKRIMDSIVPMVAQADAVRKGLDFGSFASIWKKIRSLKPDHPELARLRTDVESAIGAGTTTQLLG